MITAERDEARSAGLLDRVWHRASTDVVDRALVEVTGDWVAGLRRARRDDPALARAERRTSWSAAASSALVARGGTCMRRARYAPALPLAVGESGEASLFDGEVDA